MKILCLVSLIVCAFAQAANVDNEALPTDSVETRLEDTHLQLNLLAPDYAETEDGQHLMSEQATQERQSRNLVTDVIKDMVEDFRNVVINGNENLPPLDPLVIPVIGPFEYKAPATVAEVTINDFRTEGLRWYVLDSVTFNAIRLSFGVHITIPWITVTGSYDARARLGLLSHRAGGNFRVFAHRIEFGMDLRVGTNLFGGHLTLRELDIKIDIHDTHIQISGMTGSSIINSFINSLVQNVSQELIQSEMENVSKMLSEELFDIINDVLKDYTISDILG
uniref:Lipid-binding serum glycoprotein N-terminal domain-containing protein n=1 Tax=Heliothis virescens TaxID=7102 RepID=A0A2A4JDD6_HELVI